MTATSAKAAGKSTPLYLEIADKLREELSASGFKVGDPFPKELDLRDRFGVSRFTIRNALDVLEAEGLIARRKAVGTVVTALEPVAAYVQRLNSADDLLQYPDDTRLIPVSKRAVYADEVLAVRFGAAEGTKLTRLSALRRTGEGLDVGWIDVYLRDGLPDVFGVLGKDPRPIYKIAADGAGLQVQSVDVDLSATTVTDEQAAHLGVAPGQAALQVVRCYQDENGAVFETSVSIHPEGLYTFSVGVVQERAGNKAE